MKLPTLVGNKQPSIRFLLRKTRHFHLSAAEDGLNPSEMDIKLLFLAPTFYTNNFMGVTEKKQKTFQSWRANLYMRLNNDFEKVK